MSRKYRWRSGNQKSDGLTPRQIQVLTTIGDGLNTKEIARKLKLSDKTVDYHRKALYDIMKTNSIAKLVKMAVGFGLTSLCLVCCCSAQSAVFLQPTNPAPVVSLAWNPSPAQNVTNYFLYQGVGSFQYTNKMSLGNAVATQFTLPTRGVTYFFAVTAQDNHGLESVFSNEVNYTPSAPPAPPSMKPLVVLVAQQAPSVSGPFVDTGFNFSADPTQSPATVYRLAIAKGMQLAVVQPPMPSK